MTGTADGRYSSDWVQRFEGLDHWKLYWHQQRVMRAVVAPASSVLEVGIGTGFTANYLRTRGVHVTTLDIDASKGPDLVADLTLDEVPGIYDNVVAFEVLEHMPFDAVTRTVLPKLRAACREHLVLSLPRCRDRLLEVDIKVPRLRTRSFTISRRRSRIREPHHHWEVGQSETSLDAVVGAITDAGFRCTRQEHVGVRWFASFSTC